ncbi:MAG: 50S ribosomal protein L13 [Acidobacteria bacterium]|nr:50S ribosomal protein L13 [Acidobacteriota bacterium]
MGTYFPSKGQVKPKWYLVDAEGQVLGRMASRVALLLRGKHREQFTPFLDFGDHVIVINAAKVRLTGMMLDLKMYRHHTGYPGGLKEISARKLLEKKPEELVREAVLGMLPKNRLRKAMAGKLLVYADKQHPHQAQKPEPYRVEKAG